MSYVLARAAPVRSYQPQIRKGLDRASHKSEMSYMLARAAPIRLVVGVGRIRPMRAPRCQLVSATEAGYYHCVSRCVRRAFLCGNDGLTGRSFAHRKQWIEDRLFELATVFAAGIYAYAVMSNHVHVVIRIDPTVAAVWRAEEVAERWLRLFPVRSYGSVDADGCRVRAALIAANPTLVALYRERLSSLSWFMRCLNEPIARMANREDACSGRFWEGRYKCQALLDEAALLACMSYVDLNPVRAGAAIDLQSSHHTSVRHRLVVGLDAQTRLQPVVGGACAALSLSAGDYIELVDWTGRRLHPGKHGRIAASAPHCLIRYGVDADGWLVRVFSIETRYWRAIGSIEALIEKALAIGQRWLKGGGKRRDTRRWLAVG